VSILGLAVQFVGEGAGHTHAQDVEVHPLDAALLGAHEADVVQVGAGGLLQDLQGTRTGELEQKDLAGQILAHCIVVSLRQGVGDVRGHPVGDEVILGEADDHPVDHHQPVLVAHDAVLAAADREIGEAVDAGVGQELQRVGPGDPISRRRVEVAVEVAAFLPGHGLVAPTGVLVRHGVGEGIADVEVHAWIERGERRVRHRGGRIIGRGRRVSVVIHGGLFELSTLRCGWAGRLRERAAVLL